ncbi:ribosomal maturation YjgA family protein [Bergeyella sp. RCAD1439]|uniref:ribosomal maturation YjgA family protein n=1 Tax=Bergeyella anatis TaxID=3113737 RepID=UPI002E19D281|nr:DUF2809 domain-containing protein [Bergeyella sp. RCAD1439]
MKFDFRYFVIALLLLIIEVVIATRFQSVYWLRVYGGDVLAVPFVYALGRSFLTTPSIWKFAMGTFFLAVFIEILQYFKTAEKLGFSENSLPYIVLGNTFSWGDIVCYALGFFLILAVEKTRLSK